MKNFKRVCFNVFEVTCEGKTIFVNIFFRIVCSPLYNILYTLDKFYV